MPFTHVQFKAFLEAHGARQACPRCGTVDWTFLTESRESDAMAVFEFAAQSGESLAIVALRCRACSLLENFAAAHVQRWLDESGLPKSETGSADAPDHKTPPL